MTLQDGNTKATFWFMVAPETSNVYARVRSQPLYNMPYRVSNSISSLCTHTHARTHTRTHTHTHTHMRVSTHPHSVWGGGERRGEGGGRKRGGRGGSGRFGKAMLSATWALEVT
jgi:hypothetical protein